MFFPSKIKTKLILSFLLVFSLMLFISFFGIQSNQNLQENNETISTVIDLTNILDHSLIQTLTLIESNNFDEYLRVKGDIEELRKDFDVLEEEVHEELIKYPVFESFDEEVNKFIKLSNNILRLHKEVLILENDLSVKIESEVSAELLTEITLVLEKSAVDEQLKIEQLKELIKSLEQSKETIVSSLRITNESFERKSRGTFYIVILFSIIMLFAIYIYINNSISKPIDMLAKTARKITRGDLSNRANITSNNEIGDFAKAFNIMIDTLEANLEKISNLSTFPAENINPVIRVSKDTIVLYSNEPGKKVLKVWGANVGTKLDNTIKMIIHDCYETNSQAEIDIRIDDRIISLLFIAVKKRGYVNIYGRDITKEIESDRMKTEFVSIASHQLKTPLTGVKWMSELLLHTKLNNVQKDYATEVYNSVKRLEKLVDDLLDVANIETDAKFNLKKEEVDLVVLIRDLVSENSSVTMDLELLTKLKIMADSTKLNYAISNLIDNGIKYSKKNGKVVIKLKKEKGFSVISIQDYGLGIPSKQQNKIFEKFFRADNAVLKQTDGSGLGLYISKSIIEAHGGELSFESQEGKGSIFYIKLPIGKLE